MISPYSKILSAIKSECLYRERKIIDTINGSQITIDKKKYINFSSNDYLGLSQNNEVKKSFSNLQNIGSGASNLITGYYKQHYLLEKELANYLSCQKTLLFSSGYMANLGVFSTLKTLINCIFQDRLNHCSLLDGNRLINLKVNRYSHLDYDKLEKKLAKENSSKALIVSENIFSMDGDQVDLDILLDIAKKYRSFLLLDDAHGFGVLNSNKLSNLLNYDKGIYVATLGKAVGTMGAFVAGSCELVDFLIQKAHTYIYTTAMPQAVAQASICSLSIIKQGILQKKLQENINFFNKNISKTKLSLLPSKSAIQPIIIGCPKNVQRISKILLANNFLVPSIRYPTVPKGLDRLRITLSAIHKKNDILSLTEIINNISF